MGNLHPLRRTQQHPIVVSILRIYWHGMKSSSLLFILFLPSSVIQGAPNIRVQELRCRQGRSLILLMLLLPFCGRYFCTWWYTLLDMPHVAARGCGCCSHHCQKSGLVLVVEKLLWKINGNNNKTTISFIRGGWLSCCCFSSSKNLLEVLTYKTAHGLEI